MKKEVKKAKVAYNRKLYLAYLIDSKKHSLTSLIEETGMHKRTIETAMKGFPDIGIEYEFVQLQGAKNRQGHYRIISWSDHSRKWIKKNMRHVVDVLQ
jgi:hypothetical protein